MAKKKKKSKGIQFVEMNADKEAVRLFIGHRDKVVGISIYPNTEGGLTVDCPGTDQYFVVEGDDL